jgi:hypothetical protein
MHIGRDLGARHVPHQPMAVFGAEAIKHDPVGFLRRRLEVRESRPAQVIDDECRNATGAAMARGPFQWPSSVERLAQREMCASSNAKAACWRVIGLSGRNQYNGLSVQIAGVVTSAPWEMIMKLYVMAIALIASSTTIGFAQTSEQSQNRNQVLQQDSRPAVQASPGELMRCDQSREILNAASRDACRAIGK